MLKTFDISLDLKDKTSRQSFAINQNDLNTIEINISLTKNKAPLDISGATPRIVIKKPSRLTVLQDCEVIDALTGKVKVVLNTQGYTEAGLHQAEVYLYEGEKISVTESFSYISNKAILNDQTVESNNNWQSINDAFIKINDNFAQINESVERIENADVYNKGETDVKFNSVTASLAEKATQTALNTTNANVTANAITIATHTSQIAANANAISNIGNGSPKGTYATLTALQTAFPTGTNGIYVVIADGKWYYWNGTAWNAGGLYQSSFMNATNSNVNDTGNYFAAANVEDILQEIGLNTTNMTSDLYTVVDNGSPTNILTNGDFSNDINGWTAGNATLSVSNKTLSIVGNGTGTNPRVSQNTSTPAVSGHKVFVRVKYTLNNSNAINAVLNVYNSNLVGSFITAATQTSPVSGTSYILSGIVTVPSDWTGNLRVTLQNQYSANVGSESVLNVQYVMCVDLTNSYGSGLEPTVTTFNTWISTIPNSWFGGTTRLLTKTPKSVESYVQNNIMDNDSYDPSYLRSGLVIGSDGVTIQNLPNCYSLIFPLVPNIDYTINVENTNNNRFRLALLDHSPVANDVVTPLVNDNTVKKYTFNSGSKTYVICTIAVNQSVTGTPSITSSLFKLKENIYLNEGQIVKGTGSSPSVIKSLVDPNWSGWSEPRLNFGLNTSSSPVPAVVESPLISQGTVMAGGTHTEMMRWGYHVYEGYASDNKSRITMLVNKHIEEGRPLAELYYYLTVYDHSNAAYGWFKIGSDVKQHSFMFSRDKAIAFGEWDLRNVMTLARISPSTDLDSTYSTIAAADGAYEAENNAAQNAKCVLYLALKNASNGAMFYDTDRNSIVIKKNGKWCDMNVTEVPAGTYSF